MAIKIWNVFCDLRNIPLKQTSLVSLLCVQDMKAYILKGLLVKFQWAWQCVLGVLSMTRVYFEASPLLYICKKG